MKTFLTNFCFLVAGLIIGYFAGCGSKLDIINTKETVTVIDTIEKIVQVKVPVPHTEYIYQTDSITKYCIDSFFTEVIHNIEDGDSIPINVYRDSIIDPDYKLKYNIETIGFLNGFNYDLDIFHKSAPCPKLKRKNWMVSGAVSTQFNYKLGVGFKGWTVEGVLGKDQKELFFGHQFIF